MSDRILGACWLLVTLAAEPVLCLPSSDKPTHLRLVFWHDGAPPTKTWETFLGHLLTFYDRDGDGALSAREAGRLPALPLPERRELPLPFAKLDADRDGKVTRIELLAYATANGCGPIVVALVPPTADDARLAAVMWAALDIDRNGRLDAAELRRAAESFRRFDLNDDEFLERAELLADAPPAHPTAATVRLTSAAATAGLTVNAGTTEAFARLDDARATLILTNTPAGYRLRSADGTWTLTGRGSRSASESVSVRAFLMAQLQTALGDQPELAQADIDNDPLLGGLTELFRHADRDGNGRLSLAELAGYLRLTEHGVQAQLWLSVRERGRQPFDLLDTDGDGRLSPRELSQARAVLLPPEATTLSAFPVHVEMSSSGAKVPMWGGVPVPTATAKPPVAPGIGAAPRWFVAEDRNGDGVLSVREFLGPRRLFDRLDRNSDGLISPSEAISPSSHR